MELDNELNEIADSTLADSERAEDITDYLVELGFAES